MRKSFTLFAAAIVAVAVLVFARTSRGAPAPTRWDYKYVVVHLAERLEPGDDPMRPPPALDPTKDPLLLPLAQADADGWELVSVSDDEARERSGGRGKYPWTGYLYFFRRPKS
jgi:hypothetical protein